MKSIRFKSLIFIIIIIAVVNGQKGDKESDASTYSTNDKSSPTTSTRWPEHATNEVCQLITYNTVQCSCGTLCSSFTREYFAYAPKKCNNTILRTGEFGKEPCDLNDFFAKQIKNVNYSCMVLPCDNGEFAFTDTGYKYNNFISIAIITIISIFRVLIY